MDAAKAITDDFFGTQTPESSTPTMVASIARGNGPARCNAHRARAMFLRSQTRLQIHVQTPDGDGERRGPSVAPSVQDGLYPQSAICQGTTGTTRRKCAAARSRLPWFGPSLGAGRRGLAASPAGGRAGSVSPPARTGRRRPKRSGFPPAGPPPGRVRARECPTRPGALPSRPPRSGRSDEGAAGTARAV